jgi:hypothetical protein
VLVFSPQARFAAELLDDAGAIRGVFNLEPTGSILRLVDPSGQIRLVALFTSPINASMMPARSA